MNRYSLQFILLKMPTRIPLKWEISTTVTTIVFPGLDPFWRQTQNIDLRSNFSKCFFAHKLSYEDKSQSSKGVQREFFKFFIARDIYVTTNEFAIRQQQTTVILWEFFLSLLKLISETQSI